MFNLANRSTTDVVVLLFSLLICVVLVITITGLIIGRMIHPELDVTRGVDAVNQMLSTIIGALVGFISGRAYGRREVQSNGGQPQ